MSRKAILTQNAKMMMTMEQHPYMALYCMSMPARGTCPYAGECLKGCYAQSGKQALRDAVRAYQENLDMYNEGSFFTKLDTELLNIVLKAEKAHKQVYVRLHDSGDFFSYRYLCDWLAFMTRYPDVHFYAYTKSIPFMEKARERGIIPKNFTYVYSCGGSKDDLIEPRIHRHAIVVDSESDIPEGYVNGSHDDFPASQKDIKGIALVFHGHGKRFNTIIPE
ncbi:MAG: hypothetical protein ACI381_00815 [Candidatus Methanomethylophilaceae archaeon]